MLASAFQQGLSPFKPHSDVSRLELLPMPGNESVESDAVEWRTNEAYQRRKRPLSSNSTPPISTSSYNSLAKLVIGDPSPQSQSNVSACQSQPRPLATPLQHDITQSPLNSLQCTGPNTTVRIRSNGLVNTHISSYVMGSNIPDEAGRFSSFRHVRLIQV